MSTKIQPYSQQLQYSSPFTKEGKEINCATAKKVSFSFEKDLKKTRGNCIIIA